MPEDIIVEVSAGVMLLRMNRPEKKNAITHAMYARMADACAEADSRDDVKVVLITGSAAAFTAGNDLHDFVASGGIVAHSPVLRFINALASARKIMLAAVNGIAVGIGVTMLLHCDLVVAGESAQFVLPFLRLGLVPEAGSTLLFPALVGRRRANRHFLLGEPFGASVAQSYGLVSDVVPDADVEQRARAVADALVAKPAQALLMTKALTARGSPDVMARIEEENAAFATLLQSEDSQAALRAFFAKSNK